MTDQDKLKNLVYEHSIGKKTFFWIIGGVFGFIGFLITISFTGWSFLYTETKETKEHVSEISSTITEIKTLLKFSSIKPSSYLE
jgi:hypothetical protein